jgi:hypothetical protein
LAGLPSQSPRPEAQAKAHLPAEQETVAPVTPQQSAAVVQAAPLTLQQAKLGAPQLTVVEQHGIVPPPVVRQDMPVSAHGAQ